MSNTDFAATADMAEFDDLPRALRRERELREREKREAKTADQHKSDSPTTNRKTASAAPSPSLHVPADGMDYAASYANAETPLTPAIVKRFDVPFTHMMRFYLKAVVAAVPALILLTAICWGIGQGIKFFFPWLIQAQILIHFPN